MKKVKSIFIAIPVFITHFRALLKQLLFFSELQQGKDFVLNELNGKPLQEIEIFDIIPSFSEKVEGVTFLEGASTAIDLAFIKGIVKSKKDCDYLEIGSFRGESLINVLPDCKTATSISLSPSEMAEMNIPSDYIEADYCLVSPNEKLTRIQHNSLTFDYNSLNKKYDVIFIDGDHSTNGVKTDTKNAMKLLKDESSIIIWHDCSLSYSDIRYDVIQGIMLGTTNEQFSNFYRVRNTLCGIYKKNLKPSVIQKNVHIPNKTFNVSIDLKQRQD